LIRRFVDYQPLYKRGLPTAQSHALTFGSALFPYDERLFSLFLPIRYPATDNIPMDIDYFANFNACVPFSKKRYRLSTTV
jgi:hypothetical protein